MRIKDLPVAGSVTAQDYFIVDQATPSGSVTRKALVSTLAPAAGAISTLTSVDGSVAITGSGTTRNLSAAYTTDVVVLVRNTTGTTLTKGTVVYITGATGQTSTVSRAIASSDATSAQTLGMVREDIGNNATGYVVAIGLITNINTSAYTDGQQLYLSGSVAGGVTATKPYAPTHLVYVGVVEYAHPVNGKIFVKVQNGYELDELHDVSAQTPSNGQTLVYNSTTQLWENSAVSLTNGVSGVLPVGNGGNGTATPALTAGTNVSITGSWPNYTIAASGGAGGGDVTGPASSTDNAVVRFDGTSGKLIQNSGVQINDLGEISVGVWKGTEIGVSYGGTGAATLTGVVKGNGTSAFTAGNVNLTSEVTGTLPVGSGGTGAATFTANNVLLGNGTSAFQVVAPGTNGNVLTSNGTTWTSAAPAAGGGLTYVYKTTTYTASDKEGILTDTSGGAFTVTLPATPSTGAQVVVADAGANWGTNNLTVGRNGSTIGGLAQDLVCDITGANVQLIYDGTTWEIYAQIGGNGGNAVTLTGTQTLTNKTISGSSNTITDVSLTTGVTGTLPIANGGTGATTLAGANIAVTNAVNTFTGTQTVQAAATQDAVIIAGRAGGTSSYAVTLTPTTLSANRTVTIPNETFTVGFRNLPAVGTQTGTYTLGVNDVGKYVQVGSGGSITIPDSTFAEGDAISIFNNTTGNITITCSITTAYIAGTDTDKATMTLATRGVATILFISSTVCVVSGNVT
jgi:hypothetical protein